MPLFVALPADDLSYTLSWEGKSYTPTRVGSELRCLLPISIDCGARSTLALKSGGAVVAERDVPVKPVDYGHLSLWLPASTMNGYDDPQNKADDEAILAAMSGKGEPDWGGAFRPPCDAPQTTAFGQKRIYNGGVKRSWHKGLDLGGAPGQTVVAPANGKVVHRARGVVNGNTLVLAHGLGLYTVYMHLERIDVQPGQTLAAGEPMAAVGGTGGFAPHLHWEARILGEPVLPKAFYHPPAAWA